MSATLITGGSGMVGRALSNYIPNSLSISTRECDLRSKTATDALFESVRPDKVYHLAARVGGVQDNLNNNAEFLSDNIRINTNVLSAAHKNQTRKVISLLSTCIYPDHCDYPLEEKNIHLGEPHFTNFGYAYAKRLAEVQSRALNLYDDTRFVCVVPNNLYGENDNFDLENSHVIPGIIRKIFEAKREGTKPQLWGDGTPLREFTYVEDLAKILEMIMESKDGPDLVNVGNTTEISIAQVAKYISNYFGHDFEKINWDTSRPTGQHRKPSSDSLFKQNYKFQYTTVKEGIEKTCNWFEKNYPLVRGIL